jgi:hypothetical protein
MVKHLRARKAEGAAVESLRFAATAHKNGGDIGSAQFDDRFELGWPMVEDNHVGAPGE